MVQNFQCPGCGSNYSISKSGISGTSVHFEELGGAGTSGSKDVKQWPEAQKLRDEWKMLGINNHEEASLKYVISELADGRKF